jgi:transcriptional regulator with XRE-family HTH domain
MVYENIMKYCEEKNMSARAFEIRCGLSNGSISKWKENANPTIESLTKVAKSTGIPIEEWIK